MCLIQWGEPHLLILAVLIYKVVILHNLKCLTLLISYGNGLHRYEPSADLNFYKTNIYLERFNSNFSILFMCLNYIENTNEDKSYYQVLII